MLAEHRADAAPAGRQPVRSAVVWCLDWPVVAAGIDRSETAAVFHANRVVAASWAARQAGVERGLRRRESQRRCPELQVLDRDVGAEARAFESVVKVVEAFTPRIELTRPGRCVFATRGPSRYFGGDESMVAQVHAAVAAELGCSDVRIGVADGPFAAGLAARTPRAVADGVAIIEAGEVASFLAPLPVTSLDRGELTGVLLRLGIRTLGQFADLPPADVLGRFGLIGQGAHRLARGLDEFPPNAQDPTPDMEVHADLDPPVERVDQAAFLGRTLAEQFHENLAARGVACTRVAIEAETEHGETMVRLWRHEGALSAGAVADRVRWQLDGWLNAAPSTRPSGGLVRLSLVPDEITAAAGRQLGFWGGESAADERAVRAFARVQGMLGADAVRVPEWRGGRDPVEAIELIPLASTDLAERTVGGIEAPWPGSMPAPLPTMLHVNALAAAVVDRRGEPVQVTARGLASEAPAQLSVAGGDWVDIVAWAGPWLVDERWWDPRRHRRQARFQVVTDDGAARLVSLSGGTWTVLASFD